MCQKLKKSYEPKEKNGKVFNRNRHYILDNNWGDFSLFDSDVSVGQGNLAGFKCIE